MELLKSIHSLISVWVSEAGEHLIELKDTGTGQEIVEFYNSELGLNYINELRRNIDNLRTQEEELTQQRIDKLDQDGDYLRYALYALFILLIGLSIANSINEVTAMIKMIALRSGDCSQRVRIQSLDEMGSLGEATNELINTHANDNWVQSTAKEVIAMYQGINDLPTLIRIYLSKVAELLHATYGVFYLRSGRGQQERLVKAASFAADGEETGAEQFPIGEGLVGQSAKEHRVFVLRYIYPPLTWEQAGGDLLSIAALISLRV